ncbi:stage II sporulation protein M [Methanocaldococcus sp. 10A]
MNPLTGLVGVNLNYSDLIAILPHGFFEFFGFSIAVVAGVEISNKIYPIIKRKISYKKIALLMVSSFIFISIAGLLEPIDWYIYSYAKAYGIPLLSAFIMGYKNLFLYLLSMI